MRVSRQRHDLRHLWTYLAEQQLDWDELRPRHALGLLEYLRSVPSRKTRETGPGTPYGTLADPEGAVWKSGVHHFATRRPHHWR